jgi:outer membrane protein assembly factor BamB
VRGVGKGTLISEVALDEPTGILVGALQLPLASLDNDQFSGIKITVSLPERRLFAFNAYTGAPLWDHAPRLGNSVSLLGADSFEKRMGIAAPPLIHGGLVLVPCYELAGRITMFVAAYDLQTGELAWRTRVVSGQQRVNLFGVHESEFNSAPLRTADGKLIVLTQLGVVAALDIDTGEPIWETSYEQFDLPRNNGNYTPQRARAWQATAPIIADETIFATPVDSPDLVAFDLVTGERLWSQPAYLLDADEFASVQSEPSGLDPTAWGLAAEGFAASAHSRGGVDHLVAASRGKVWLGGDHLVAWTNSTGDLSKSQPSRQAFGAWPTPGGLVINRPVSPRPLAVAAGDSILVPSDWGVLAVDRSTGQAKSIGPFGQEGSLYYSAGSLGAGPGVLVHLDEWRLTGWMHWGTLVEGGVARLAQARSTDSPDADRFALDLARLHINYATSNGLNPGVAWQELEKAAELLFAADGSDAKFAFFGTAMTEERSAMSQAELVAARFELLETKAAWQGAFGDIDLALTFASAAALRAPDQAALCRVLHSQVNYLGSPLGEAKRFRAARLEALGRLIQECPRELTPEQYVGTPLDPDTADFVEAIRLIGGPYARPELPVGATALVARAAVWARAGDFEATLADLHRALWDYGLLPLAGELTLGTLLEARIESTIETAPPGSYDAQEAAAEAQLATALTVQAPAQRAAVVAGVLRRWPHSKASHKARRQLLDIEIEQFGRGLATLETLAERVMGVLDDDPSPTLEWSALYALGWAAGQSGNPHLARMILDRALAIGALAGDSLAADVKSARQLRDSLRKTPNAGSIERTPVLGTPLSIEASSGGVRFGPFEPILTMDAALPGGGTQTILLSGQSYELFAFAATRHDATGDPTGEPILWKLPIGVRAGAPWSRLICALPKVAPEVICAITTGGLVGIDPISGDLLWGLDRPGMRAMELAGDMHAAGGLLIVQWLDSEGRLVVEGLDALGGASLWQTRIDPDQLDEFAGASALVSGDRVALLSRENDSGGLILDTVRGEIGPSLELVGSADIRDRKAAWTIGDQLFVPHFFAATDTRPNTLDAFDLATGKLSYQIDLKRGTELAGIAHFENKSYLWLLPTRAPGAPAGTSNKAQLIEFNPGLGTTRKVAELSFGDRVIGLPMGETLQLDGPLLMVNSRPTLAPGSVNQAPMVLRAIALPGGPLWTLNITPPAIVGQGLYDGDLPAIVLARDTIAMTYAITKNGSSLGRTSRLLLLDRSDGHVLEDRALTSTLGRVEGMSLRGLGGDLYLFGRGIGSGRGRLEVWGGKVMPGGSR